MKLALILLLLLAVIAFSIWYARKKGAGAEFDSLLNPGEISITGDSAIDFGYKNVWLAVRTIDKMELAQFLGLKNLQAANWKSGLEHAYSDAVFVTPPIGEWTLAVGMKLPQGDSPESIENLEFLLNQLSTRFGEAQFFGTHRVVEFHAWIKSVNGKIVRSYAYLGESGETLRAFGKNTEAEKSLNLFNSLSEEAKLDAYGEREDLVYPDEELVMRIAEHWSVNPTKLSERSDVGDQLGLIGK